MDRFKSSLAFWATILGTSAALFGAFQSIRWVFAVGVAAALLSVGVLAYAFQQRELLKSAGIKIDGRSIDSLNVASLRRRLNRSLVVQKLENETIIDGDGAKLAWRCSGYCKGKREAVIEFSIDADSNTPFNDLDCVAFDLRADPAMKHRIRPLLVGPDGISKKLAVPFLTPLSANDPFSVLLQWNISGCMNWGVDYCTTTLSFDQERVPSYSTRLTFLHDFPVWLRVYEWRMGREVELLRDLRPIRTVSEIREYLDTDTNVAADSARIYLFLRPAPIAKAA